MPKLGELERAVMEVLWGRADAATVRDVHAALADSRDIAYTTVMTVLDRLAKKGVVSRRLEGRAWLYVPEYSCADLHADEIVLLMGSCSDATRREILTIVSDRLGLDAE